jgi:hypothetical protein
MKSKLLIILLLCSVSVVGQKASKNKKDGADQKTDSVVVTAADSLAFYKNELSKKDSLITVLNERIQKDSLHLSDTLLEISKCVAETDALLNASQSALKDSVALLSELRRAFESEFFYELVMLYPIEVVYDSVDVANRLSFVKTLHLDTKYPAVTKKYYNLVKNYKDYRVEVAKCIDKVVFQFTITGGKPSLEPVRDAYYNELHKTDYWKQKTASGNDIPYIERRLEKVDDLYRKPANFKKENFEKVIEELLRPR